MSPSARRPFGAHTNARRTTPQHFHPTPQTTRAWWRRHGAPTIQPRTAPQPERGPRRGRLLGASWTALVAGLLALAAGHLVAIADTLAVAIAHIVGLAGRRTVAVPHEALVLGGEVIVGEALLVQGGA
jgi:hypothetical protein